MKIKCSLHSRCIDKQDPQKVAKGWLSDWKTPEEIAAHIQRGYGWTATHFRDGHRKQANAQGSNCVVFDFDGDCSLEKFWTTKVAQDWCVMTYTSASHTPEVHRFRALFPIEGMPMTTVWEHRCTYDWIALKLAAQLGIDDFEDNCGRKPERLWYGNRNAEVIHNADACVPIAVAATIPIPDEPQFAAKGMDGVTDIDIKRAIFVLENFLRPTEEGEYNSFYLPITAACASIGDQMVDAWRHWVSKGHHGSKPANLDPSLKWNGLTCGGPATIFKHAKMQDNRWSSFLPEALSFNPGSGQSMDLDAILAQSMNTAPRYMFRRS
ncbi:hypothetical protein [Synechococcus sp. WH 8016]|uniref:hypothetical protein n=1 Tax=Synechococcus sp. WH 8016 TaxID=166318 RepID=UPI00022D7D92|nr:hypothetical protein [Synechococcus sp. WH 8016]EHA63798.1 hypothetical protein Syn8016DRAFT_0839 [Synechococcus sp. WH 8016]